MPKRSTNNKRKASKTADADAEKKRKPPPPPGGSEISRDNKEEEEHPPPPPDKNDDDIHNNDDDDSMEPSEAWRTTLRSILDNNVMDHKQKEKKKNRTKGNNNASREDDQDLMAVTRIIIQKFEMQLQLVHVPNDEVMNIIVRNNSNKISSIAAKKEQLRKLAISWYRQTQKAKKVFQLMDVHGKSCIVLDDIKNAIGILDDSQVDIQDAQSMMDEFATLDNDDDFLQVLTLDDMIRIARLVNL